MARPTGLDHVGLKVTDMDRSLRFYQALGLMVLRRSRPNADGLRSAVVQAGSQEFNLFARADFVPAAPETAVGVDHFCLAMETASIDDLTARFRAVAEEDLHAGAIARRTTSSSALG
jgi:catechol 2,3-dioxygenase-like lactoylglutathione lyase family enzyme